MTPSGQKICLSMIVKNEISVIARCIASLRTVIDHWIIVDTGSTDGTQDLIRSELADIPGALIERPWVDFAYNRTEALKLARQHGEYTLVIDADDELIVPPGFIMPVLDAPGYNIKIKDSNTTYSRIQLFNNKNKWFYRGVLHEFAECSESVWTGTLPIAMRRGHDGARRLDNETYRRDADILERALKKEKDPFMISRYTYYLAQSYRDCQEQRNAIKYYLKRTTMGFWSEEIYISFLGAAFLMEYLNRPFKEVIATFDNAIATNPRRGEAFFHASRYCKDKGYFVEGYHYAEQGIKLTLPVDGLFLQPWIYMYGLKDKFAIHAFNTGQYRACLSACISVLGCQDFPAEDRMSRADLARMALSKMIDPVWGVKNSPFGEDFPNSWVNSAFNA